MDHELLRAVRPLVATARARRSEPVLRVPARAADRRGTNPAAVAAAGAAHRGGQDRGDSRLSGERAAEEAEARRGRSIHVRRVAARPRSPRALLSRSGFPRSQDPPGGCQARAAGRARMEPRRRRVVLEYRITRGPSTQLVVVAPRSRTPSAIASSNDGRPPCSTAFSSGMRGRSCGSTSTRNTWTRPSPPSRRIARASKTLTIDVAPGTVVPRRIDVTGNSAVPDAQLVELASAGDPFAAWLDPRPWSVCSRTTTGPRDSLRQTSRSGRQK